MFAPAQGETCDTAALRASHHITITITITIMVRVRDDQSCQSWAYP
jgi:hypothetical protein